jgi:hypothetical protein
MTSVKTTVNARRRLREGSAAPGGTQVALYRVGEDQEPHVVVVLERRGSEVQDRFDRILQPGPAVALRGQAASRVQDQHHLLATFVFITAGHHLAPARGRFPVDGPGVFPGDPFGQTLEHPSLAQLPDTAETGLATALRRRQERPERHALERRKDRDFPRQLQPALSDRQTPGPGDTDLHRSTTAGASSHRLDRQRLADRALGGKLQLSPGGSLKPERPRQCLTNLQLSAEGEWVVPDIRNRKRPADGECGRGLAFRAKFANRGGGDSPRVDHQRDDPEQVEHQQQR